MDDCIFCKIARKEIPADIVYEDSKFVVFLDIAPINKGHCLVVPKEHYENIYDVPEELFKDMSALMKRTAIAAKKGVHADGINIGINNDAAAGQLVFHIHGHVMPRFKGDGYKYWKREDKLSKSDMDDAKSSIKKAF